ncbi:MAG: hypothetical protein U1C57_00685 [Candidatus Doudnabacteria bacterium]|nr:hypothetical protein [Candidatus Doudnabacteria bacterium]
MRVTMFKYPPDDINPTRYISIEPGTKVPTKATDSAKAIKK